MICDSEDSDDMFPRRTYWEHKIQEESNISDAKMRLDMRMKEPKHTQQKSPKYMHRGGIHAVMSTRIRQMRKEAGNTNVGDIDSEAKFMSVSQVTNLFSHSKICEDANTASRRKRVRRQISSPKGLRKPKAGSKRNSLNGQGSSSSIEFGSMEWLRQSPPPTHSPGMSVNWGSGNLGNGGGCSLVFGGAPMWSSNSENKLETSNKLSSSRKSSSGNGGGNGNVESTNTPQQHGYNLRSTSKLF